MLLYNISDGLLKKLQRVQNAAACLIFDARKNDHATPLLRDLHWLPVRRRIDYKLCSLVYKCLLDAAPEYLSTCCVTVADIPGRRHLRSASRFMVTVPRTKTKVGARAFGVSGPSEWNSLPQHLRDPGLSYDSFQKALKTVLFDRAYN